jgi:hypothetical protein
VLRTDADADETRAALALLQRFPAVAEHQEMLERQVLSALGDEAALVALVGGELVLLVRPDDREALDELLEKADREAVTRQVEGWTAVAEDEAALDALERERAKGLLADDEGFRAEFGALPDDALAKLWVADGGDWQIPATAAAVFAEDDGLRLQATAADPDGAAEPYRAELLDRVPAGVSLVASFRGQDGLGERLRSLPFPPGLGLGAVAEVLEDEGVLYVRRSLLLPEVTLLTAVEDEQEATAAVRRLLGSLDAPAGPGDSGTEGTVDLGIATITYGARDGILVVTTSAAGLDVLEPGRDALGDDPRFRRAAEKAGLPDESAGFLYVRLDDLVPLVLGLAGMQGERPPDELRENLEPLRELFVWAGRDGDRATYEGFLELASR